MGPRRAQADFSGGTLAPDAGALLLRQVNIHLGRTAELAQCFDDERDPVWVDHSAQELQRQRLFGTALGYEDINDPDYGETPAGLAGRSGTGLKE